MGINPENEMACAYRNMGGLSGPDCGQKRGEEMAVMIQARNAAVFGLRASIQYS